MSAEIGRLAGIMTKLDRVPTAPERDVVPPPAVREIAKDTRTSFLSWSPPLAANSRVGA